MCKLGISLQTDLSDAAVSWVCRVVPTHLPYLLGEHFLAHLSETCVYLAFPYTFKRLMCISLIFTRTGYFGTCISVLKIWLLPVYFHVYLSERCVHWASSARTSV